jgi:hypothetical protein
VKGFDNLTNYKKIVKNTIETYELNTPISFKLLNSYVYRYDVNNDVNNIKNKKLKKNEINELLKKYNLPSQQEYINKRNKIIISEKIKKLKKKLLRYNIE